MSRRRWGRVVPAVITAGIALLPVALSSSGGVLGGGHPPIVRLRQGTSTNWSGYAAYGAAGSFSSVTASWTQPAVSCTAENRYSSYWVGLDGYNTSTVEQLGTEGDCINGAPRYYAWYEMYPKRSALISLTVTPGRSYTASVVAGSRGSFVLQLTDVTNRISFTTPQRLNNAAGASAEAVVEAPSNGKVLPLANFGTASFTGVTVNGQPIGSFAPNLDPITMLNPDGMKATPSKLDSTGKQFSVTWSSS